MTITEALDRIGPILSPIQSLLLRPYRNCKMPLGEWLVLFERFDIEIPQYVHYKEEKI